MLTQQLAPRSVYIHSVGVREAALAESFATLCDQLTWPRSVTDVGILAVGADGIVITPEDRTALVLKGAIERFTNLPIKSSGLSRQANDPDRMNIIIGSKPHWFQSADLSTQRATTTGIEPLFRVEHVAAAQGAHDGREHFDLTVNVRFVQPIRNGTILMHVNAWAPKTLVMNKALDVVEDEQMKLIIARIPLADTENGVWNPLGPNDQRFPIVGVIKSIATIDVQAPDGAGRQKFRLYVETMRKGVGTSGRFFFTAQSRDLFDESRPLNPVGGHYLSN